MKKRILAIDDSKAIRFLLQTVLGKDYQMITAPDGCSAMYWLSKRNIPDLIICDPQLPDMKDWELIRELRSSILYRSIPILVISALDEELTRLKCDQYSLAGYFMKPFNPLLLLDEIEKVTAEKTSESMQLP